MTRQPTRQATDAEQRQIERAILAALLTKGEAATTDDAHELFELPDDVEPRTWGAITGGLQAKGLIRRVGDRHTTRRIAHGRRIGLFRVTDAARARQRCELLAASAGRKRPAQLSLPLEDADSEAKSEPAN